MISFFKPQNPFAIMFLLKTVTLAIYQQAILFGCFVHLFVCFKLN